MAPRALGDVDSIGPSAYPTGAGIAEVTIGVPTGDRKQRETLPSADICVNARLKGSLDFLEARIARLRHLCEVPLSSPQACAPFFC